MKFKDLKNKIMKDYNFRTYWFSFFSFLASIAFAIYNAFLGIYYQSLFNGSIAVYYLLLIIVRMIIILFELHWTKLDSDKIENKRFGLFIGACPLLILINIALIVPISLMVLNQKNVLMGLIPAIAMAAYTTFKITMAIINYKKTRKNDHLSIRALRIINMIDALVSILSLQNTLIVVNGGSQSEDMMILSGVSSLVIILSILIIIIISLIRALKFRK
ncbi:MAG: hypothetical protein K2H02_00540 [Anaeroplasmataceae bacterium]|nr:hypothetical protein [Anaeroplasmataceae bacterium]